jgi:hypothetical protein
MRIAREGGLITMRDRAAPHWFLGLFLLAGGLMAIAMPLGLANNADDLETGERLGSLLVGLGVSAGALWLLARSPGTELQLDLTRRSLTLIRRGILGRRVRQLPFDRLASVDLEAGKDSDGDPVWRPVLRLRDGEQVPLSVLWEHDEKGVRAAATSFAEACRLPPPPRPAAIEGVARSRQR